MRLAIALYILFAGVVSAQTAFTIFTPSCSDYHVSSPYTFGIAACIINGITDAATSESVRPNMESVNCDSIAFLDATGTGSGTELYGVAHGSVVDIEVEEDTWVYPDGDGIEVGSSSPC